MDPANTPILVVGPHPDDQELGMGGTIALLADRGHDVLLLDMTDGEPTPRGNPATRAAEAAGAARELAPAAGPGRVRRALLGLQNRTVEHTIEARRRVAGVIRAHGSRVIFVPFPEDAHPDHRAVTRIVEDARFDAKLTGLEVPACPGAGPVGSPIYAPWLFYYYATHLRIVPLPTFLMDVSAQAGRKAAAIAAYRSQFELNEKNRGVPRWVAAAGEFYGSRIGVAHAEPFFTPEPPGLRDLSSLVG